MPGQEHAGEEEASGEDRCGPRQEVRGAAARHEACAAAHAEAAAFRLLEQDGADHDGDDHEVDDDDNGLHSVLPSQAGGA
ncbi:hypothetical protein ABH988_005204 [Bradyrhizobium ottawaense]